MMAKGLRKVFSQLKPVESITASTTLDVYDSGKIFNLTVGSAAVVITLPTATTAAEASALLGWNAEFVVGTNNSGMGTASTTIVRQDTDNDSLVGIVATNSQDTIANLTLSGHTITIVTNVFGDGPASAGDKIKIVCTASTASATTFVATCFSAGKGD